MIYPQINKIPKRFWKNRKWYIKRFAWYPYNISPVGAGTIYANYKLYKWGFRWAGTFTGTKAEWFWDERDLLRVRRIILKKSKKFIQKLANNFFKAFYQFKKISVEAGNVDLAKLSDLKLWRLYQQIFWAEVPVGGHGYLVDSFLNSGSGDWLTDLILKYLPKKISLAEKQMIISQLTAPTYNTFINQEKIDLLKIALIKNKTQRRKKLEKHQAEYHWLENNYYIIHNLSQKYFADKIKIWEKQKINFRRELNKEIQRPIINRRDKQEIYKKYKLSRELSQTIWLADLFTYIQDYRKQGVLRINHFLFNFIKELNRRFNLTELEAKQLMEPDVKRLLLEHKINKLEIQRRIDQCFIYFGRKGYVVLSGRKAGKINDKIFHASIDKSTQLTGTPACGGKVKGKIRIILNNDQFKDFKSGEILVANNTTPEFVPLMKKAKAIITEQGGITTHAAIVSRELNIPCLIGVKDALRQLSTGQKIELDATKGIIKNIN